MDSRSIRLSTEETQKHRLFNRIQFCRNDETLLCSQPLEVTIENDKLSEEHLLAFQAASEMSRHLFVNVHEVSFQRGRHYVRESCIRNMQSR